MNYPFRCPYIAAQYDALRRERGLTMSDTLDRWRTIHAQMLSLEIPARKIKLFGLDNPFMSELARGLMIRESERAKKQQPKPKRRVAA